MHQQQRTEINRKFMQILSFHLRTHVEEGAATIHLLAWEKARRSKSDENSLSLGMLGLSSKQSFCKEFRYRALATASARYREGKDPNG